MMTQMQSRMGFPVGRRIDPVKDTRRKTSAAQARVHDQMRNRRTAARGGVRIRRFTAPARGAGARRTGHVADGREEGSNGDEENAGRRGQSDDGQRVAQRVHQARGADKHEERCRRGEVRARRHLLVLIVGKFLISIALARCHVLLRNELITEILITDHKNSANFAEQENDEAKKPDDAAGNQPGDNTSHKVRMCLDVFRHNANSRAGVESFRWKCKISIEHRHLCGWTLNRHC
mmetsp:Transcript_4414/g.9835  ORF Transcript_4414/g.9835 Transcript_4414/m.9835 type:complete len:234 (+) Transcript_4414:612-1313(+)